MSHLADPAAVSAIAGRMPDQGTIGPWRVAGLPGGRGCPRPKLLSQTTVWSSSDCASKTIVRAQREPPFQSPQCKNGPPPASSPHVSPQE